MKQTMRIVFGILLLLCIPQCLHAAGGLTVLSDKELAGIKGGFCILEACEAPPGTGLCMPFTPTSRSICAFTFCRFSQEIVGSVTVNSCGYLGPTTCTVPITYQQCILAFTQASCFDGPIGPCGFNYVPDCFPDIPNRECVCFGKQTDEPCDWTDCVTGP